MEQPHVDLYKRSRKANILLLTAFVTFLITITVRNRFVDSIYPGLSYVRGSLFWVASIVIFTQLGWSLFPFLRTGIYTFKIEIISLIGYIVSNVGLFGYMYSQYGNRIDVTPGQHDAYFIATWALLQGIVFFVLFLRALGLAAKRVLSHKFHHVATN